MSKVNPPGNSKHSEDELRARQAELRAELAPKRKPPAPERRLEGAAVPRATSSVLAGTRSQLLPAPNWDYWANMPEVELCEAVALSFPFDPEALKWDRHAWMGRDSSEPHIDYDESFSDPADAHAYRNRYKLLAASYWNQEYFSPAKIHMGSAHRNGVKLPEFARWASTQPLYHPLPGPLEALIQRAKAQPVSSGRANWSKWRLIPRAALWKVVCLSLDIEPREDIHAASLRTRRRFVSGVPNLQDRLEILQANLSTNGPIHPQGALYQGMLQDPNCEVLLSEVAAFLLAHGEQVPAEMGALGNAATGPEQNESEGADGSKGTGKRWTPDALAKLRAFREQHTAAETALEFGISEGRIRQLLSSKAKNADKVASLSSVWGRKG